jgi:RNA polymerase sigma-32 factor
MDQITKDLVVIQPQLPIGSLDAYIQRINDIPMLSAEEEHRLATQFQEQGDLKAAQQLVLAHLKYVGRVSRGYLGYGLPLGDLMQEGTVGLMKAVKRFDPKMGVRLVSFAVHWIKAEIHEYVLRNWRIVKVATTKAQRKLFFNLRSAKKRLGWITKEEVDTIAADLGVSDTEVRRMEERLNARDVAFDLPAANSDREDSHALVPSEYLEDQAANPAIQLESDNWDESVDGKLKIAFEQLDLRSQAILEKRWLAENKETLQTLAETYQVSPERIRQLENNALKKLKQLMLAAA